MMMVMRMVVFFISFFSLGVLGLGGLVELFYSEHAKVGKC